MSEDKEKIEAEIARICEQPDDLVILGDVDSTVSIASAHDVFRLRTGVALKIMGTIKDGAGVEAFVEKVSELARLNSNL